jgi:hypothetical protein
LFYVSIDIISWIIFICLKYIRLDLNLRQSTFLKTLTNTSEFQHMKYICDEIILVTEYEKSSKLGLWVEFFGEFFCG